MTATPPPPEPPAGGRGIPLLPTLVVAAAVAIMIGLGIWQLHRAEWKEGLLSRYRQAQALSAEVPWPRTAAEREAALFRASYLDCREVLSLGARTGTSERGESGWAHIARCRLADGSEADVAVGWSKSPEPPAWNGGEVRGTIAPSGTLYARQAAPGLERLRQPDPNDLPNNHMAYAVQWFLFALTAAAIYSLALRRRRRG